LRLFHSEQSAWGNYPLSAVDNAFGRSAKKRVILLSAISDLTASSSLTVENCGRWEGVWSTPPHLQLQSSSDQKDGATLQKTEAGGKLRNSALRDSLKMEP
jgi:hypothetical protein